jgi:hypothetical protein
MADNTPAASTTIPQTDREQSRQELKEAVHESNDVLATAVSFGLFPDTLTLDRIQITVQRRLFLRLGDITSMRIEDVLNVVASVGPIFGRLQFFSRTASIEPCTINYLWRADALRMKRIAQGYVVAIQRGIDCKSLSTSELVKLLDQLDMPS